MGPRHTLVLAALVAATAAACGGRQRDFGPIGYGWPVQCGEVRQQYRDRVAAAESSHPAGAPDGARHLAASISADALGDTASALVEDYERRANERLADIGGDGLDGTRLDLDAGDAELRRVDGTSALDIAVTGTLDFGWSGDENAVVPGQLSLSARLLVGLALEDDDGAAEIMVVPGASGFHDIAFDDEAPEGDGERNDGGAISDAIHEGVRDALGETLGEVRVARLEPLPLGDSDVTLTPVEVRAVPQTHELVVTFRTNLPVDASSQPAGLIAETDAAIWVDDDVLGPLLRTLTESIGGRAIDKKGRPGGSIRAFVNDVETRDGQIVAIQEGYNIGFPCSWTVTRMVASFDIDDGDLTVTIHELEPVSASRQRWLVNLASPDPSVIAGNMSDQLGQHIAPPAFTLTGDAELALRLTDILPNPDGVVIRAVIDASGPQGDAEAMVLPLVDVARATATAATRSAP